MMSVVMIDLDAVSFAHKFESSSGKLVSSERGGACLKAYAEDLVSAYGSGKRVV